MTSLEDRWCGSPAHQEDVPAGLPQL